MKKVIGLTGMPGCGKEEFLKVAEEKGLRIVRMGDIVREEARKRGLKFSDATVGGMAHEERERYGYGIWADRTIPHVRGEITIVDGVRSKEEIEAFRREFGDCLVIVAMHASPKIRYQRLVGRKRRDDVSSKREFLRRERRELAWGIAEVIALADYMIINEGSIEQLRKEARRTLEKILH